MKPGALVLGVNGQDGSYLAEHMLARGYPVLGVGKQTASRYISEGNGFRYASLDLTDLTALDRILAAERPALLAHFAAVHGPSGFSYESAWRELHAVNVGVVHTLLEHVRTRAPGGRLLYPGSMKVFGTPLPVRITAETPRRTTCLYSLTKNASHELVDYYRERHGVQATIVHLFQHESPRRASEYFVPKAVAALAAALRGEGAEFEPRTLAFHANWGDAREYMGLCADLLEAEEAGDFLMAHESTWNGAEFVRALYARYGIPAPAIAEGGTPIEPPFAVDTSPLARATGRRPVRGILEVCDWILEEVHGMDGRALALLRGRAEEGGNAGTGQD